MSTVVFDQDFVAELLKDPQGVVERMGVEYDGEVREAIEALIKLEAGKEPEDRLLTKLATWKVKKNSEGRVDLIFP